MPVPWEPNRLQLHSTIHLIGPGPAFMRTREPLTRESIRRRSSLTYPTPTQPKPLTATFAYYAAFITLGATVSIGGPSLPWLAQHTASRLDQISIIFVASSLGYMLGSQFGGRAYDRFPGHRIQALGLLVASLGATLVPVLHSLWFLVAVLFLLGAAQGALDVGCNTLLTWIHGEKVGPFMNGLHFFFGVGSFVAPLVFARVVLVANDIRWAYWFFSLLALPIAGWLWFLPSPQIRKKAPDAASGRSNKGLFLIIVFFFVFYVGLEVGFGNWIYTFSTRLHLASESGAAYLTSAFWGAFTVGRLLGIGISSRLRPQTILLTDLAGSLAAFAILLAWPASPLALWAGTIVLGLSIASIFATAMAFAEQRLRLTGVLIGWILVGAGIGGMFFPWLIGQLFERISPRITMPILLANTLIEFGLLLALILPLRKKETVK
jgi:MFS transporter, FHS family, Na+ dependent glucose transporter 1